MRIVRKAKLGYPLKPEGESVGDAEWLLNRWYDLCCKGASTAHLHMGVAEVLKTLRDRQLWIACDCQPDSESIPILCPVRLDFVGQRYSFRRIRPQHPHHRRCPFYRISRLEDKFAFDCDDLVLRPSSTLQHARSSSTRALRPLGASVSFALDLADRQAVIPIAQSEERLFRQWGDRPSQRRPKLARILFTLLEEARLHILRPDASLEVDSERAYRQLRTLERTQRHMIARIPLAHYLTTQPGAIADGIRRLEALSLNKRSEWPSHVKPQAFFVGLASGVDREERWIELVGEPGRLQVEEPPIVYSPPNPSRAAPYWAIAHISESFRYPGTYVARQAYLHPVYSTSLLVAVDSDAERQTLTVLVRVQRQLRRQGISMTIAKPLHDFVMEAGASCRPDFLLYRDQGDRQGKRNIVIETMGFDDDEYRQRKYRTHGLMASLGQVIDLDFCRPLTVARQEDFQQQVFARAAQLFGN